MIKKHLVKILALVVVVASITSSVFAYDYTGSFSKNFNNNKVTIAGAMSLVSGNGVTQGTKRSGSTYYTLFVSVSAYNSKGYRDYDSKSSTSTGDILASAIAPSSGTPSYAVCAASYNTASGGTAYNVCNYTVAAA